MSKKKKWWKIKSVKNRREAEFQMQTNIYLGTWMTYFEEKKINMAFMSVYNKVFLRLCDNWVSVAELTRSKIVDDRIRASKMRVYSSDTVWV